MASYMDMITVLMCMFIVLFAMSSVDANKFAALKESLATGFGQTKTKKVDTASGTVVKADQATKEGDGYSASKTDAKTATAASGEKSTNSDAAGSGGRPPRPRPPPAAQTPAQLEGQHEAATKEVDDLDRDQEARSPKKLGAKGLTQDVKFTIDSRGLTVRLVGSETFFGSNSADLSGWPKQVMDAIAPVLKAAGHNVSVEGHADSRDSTARMRRTGSCRRPGDRGAPRPRRARGDAAGDTDPVGRLRLVEAARQGDTDADLAKNRRVDIVVLSNQTDEVNALIPKIAARRDGAAAKQVSMPDRATFL